ncbi:MAG: sigma-70 family RNA polymerase sigma factor [Candidatus Krumholzibacteriota bacterium]|nr:sigma-70 family RNA polymerase sigma factor [Candidatus Krumholzibacteriota bacterium]
MSECDSLLVAESLKGDRNAYEALVKKYEKKIFNLAFRITNNYEDAMDITQTAFIKAYEKLDSFDPSFKFFSWLYRITTNEALNLVKRNNRSRPRSGETSMSVIGNITSSQPNPEEQMIKNETSGRVQEMLMRLKDDSRVIIILKHFVDMSYNEIGDVLEIPLTTVKSRLYDARQDLVRLLAE